MPRRVLTDFEQSVVGPCSGQTASEQEKHEKLDDADPGAEHTYGMADIRRRPLDVDGYRVELSVFERRYQVPSSRLADAFTSNGRLIESADFRRWSFIYGVLRRRGLAA